MTFEGPKDMPHFRGKKHGRALLTTHRVNIHTQAQWLLFKRSHKRLFYNFTHISVCRNRFLLNCLTCVLSFTY